MKWTLHWGSHIPVLIKVIENSEDDVLELGMGVYSTPLLHWMCTPSGRRVVSYENHANYFSLFQNGLNQFHETYLVDNLDDIDISQEWGVAFIDSEPMEQRARLAQRLLYNCRFVILHDTQDREEKFYGYKRIYPLFKYRYNYTQFKPNTTVLSNLDNLEFLNG